MRAVGQVGFCGAPCSVRAVPRHRGLPNVKHQDATGARESCEGPEGARSLAICQQIVKHAPSDYSIKHSGDCWFTQVCREGRCVGAALTGNCEQSLRGVEQGDIVSTFDQCSSVASCATASIQHLCVVESSGLQCFIHSLYPRLDWVSNQGVVGVGMAVIERPLSSHVSGRRCHFDSVPHVVPMAAQRPQLGTSVHIAARSGRSREGRSCCLGASQSVPRVSTTSRWRPGSRCRTFRQRL